MNEAPIADFSGAPTSGSVPLTVAFTDVSSGNPTTWSWDFDDGGASTEQNPSHTYNDLGTYTVTLTVSNDAGPDTKMKMDYITVVAGATETIEITKATYSSRKGQLKVQATSSLGGDLDTSLTATFFDGTTELPVGGKAMNYNGNKNKWSVTFDSDDELTTKPDKVQVCSTNTCVERTDIGGK